MKKFENKYRHIDTMSDNITKAKGITPMKSAITTPVFALMFFALLLSGCDERSASSDELQRRQTEEAAREANAEVGMPAIVNYQERKLAKMIFELRDSEDLITFVYITNLNGDRIFLGKAIGFGLPYSVQYTNPQRVQRVGRTNYHYITLPQADPNMLFMPEGLSATWVMLIDPETGDPRPVYVEQEVMISPFPLH